MDTRDKIITPARALEIGWELRRQRRPLRVATGYFDVLQAGAIRQLLSLASKGGTLMTLVLTPPAPLLSPGARAELTAAIRVIDYVVLIAGSWDLHTGELLAQLDPAEIIHMEVSDAAARDRLIAHVRQRHAS